LSGIIFISLLLVPDSLFGKTRRLCWRRYLQSLYYRYIRKCERLLSSMHQ